ncbi:TadE/TadG family type IV pilus assembly protein [Paenibacillus allorhizosphaerae]|uniref:TadE-like domain-containing protein n=1 Tax=Paenibacillus allorhizosphaerae TaxID=2849866 RepID=A0ABM8VEU1_9BACL|nr:TadE/TadG family type IV pilus assembly protein [Paenibacillus allorhizosphaerae]CAG7630020.1 hypothetical protein PAECIP111802_01611 [Paenibacillus allorhizosphaerae]
MTRSKITAYARMRRLRPIFGIIKGQQGSIVVETAFTLPFFAAFLMVLLGFIRMAQADMALQSAVSETAKVVAANMYPVEQIYRVGQSQWASSAPSAWLGNVITMTEAARQKVLDAETFADDYERWIPDPLLQLVRLEKERREQLEAWGGSVSEDAKKKLNEQLAKAATPLVASLSGIPKLDKDRFRVTEIGFPSFDDKNEAFLSIEAEYEYKFAVPFFHKTVILKKKAVERAWIGGVG